MKILSNKKYNELILKPLQGCFAQVNDNQLLRENGLLYAENKKLHSIIKEVREHCNLHLKTAKEVIVESEKWLEVEEQAEFAKRDIHTAKVVKRNMEDILEILDKENI